MLVSLVEPLFGKNTHHTNCYWLINKTENVAALSHPKNKYLQSAPILQNVKTPKRLITLHKIHKVEDRCATCFFVQPLSMDYWLTSSLRNNVPFSCMHNIVIFFYWRLEIELSINLNICAFLEKKFRSIELTKKMLMPKL